MINRQRAFVLISTLVIVLVGCYKSSPLEESLRGVAPDVKIYTEVEEFFIRTEQGNLVDATVFSDLERRMQVEDFINKHKAAFGISTKDNLEFVQSGSETDFEYSEKLLTAVTLSQYINGMRILDYDQLGVFDLETGMLKAVKVHIIEPARLKDASAPKTNKGIMPLAESFIEEQGIVCTEMTVLDDPAYSLVAAIAGYEIRCISRPNSQSLLRIKLLVNPDSGKVIFLSKEEIDMPQEPTK